MSISIKNVAQTDRRFFPCDIPSDEILALLRVPKESAEYIRVLDKSGDLQLIHYLTPIDEKGAEDDIKFRNIEHVRGVIVDTKNLRIVCNGIGRVDEIPLHIGDLINPVICNIFDSIAAAHPPPSMYCAMDGTTVPYGHPLLYYAAEGALVRIYWYAGEWHLATHRKIDASKSYWNGPTFDDIFKELIDIDYNLLDKECAYSFLLSHPGTRLIYPVPADQACITLTCIHDLRTGKNEVHGDNWPKLETRKGARVQTFGDKHIRHAVSLETLCYIINDMSQPPGHFSKTGVIVYLMRNDNILPIKVVSDDYLEMRKIRGNYPCLRSRCVQLLGTLDGEKLEKWFHEPEYQEVYIRVRNEIADLTKYLHGLYVSRYIKKDNSELPKEEFVTIQRAHTWHRESRSTNLVTVRKISEMISTTPGHFVLIMLNRRRDFLFDQKVVSCAPNHKNRIGFE